MRWLGSTARSQLLERVGVPSTWPGGAPFAVKIPSPPRRNIALHLRKVAGCRHGRNPAVNRHKRLGERCCSWGQLPADALLGNAKVCWFGFRSLFPCSFFFAVDWPGPLAESATTMRDHAAPRSHVMNTSIRESATNNSLPGRARLLNLAGLLHHGRRADSSQAL